MRERKALSLSFPQFSVAFPQRGGLVQSQGTADLLELNIAATAGRLSDNIVSSG